MDMKEIAKELVEGCRKGEDAIRANLDKLYAADAVSAEAADMDGSGREVTGLDAIKGKHDWWNGAFEEHSSSAKGPFWHGEDKFGVLFEVDATEKESGKRMQMAELGVYHVKDGKIVREEFFYKVE